MTKRNPQDDARPTAGSNRRMLQVLDADVRVCERARARAHRSAGGLLHDGDRADAELPDRWPMESAWHLCWERLRQPNSLGALTQVGDLS